MREFHVSDSCKIAVFLRIIRLNPNGAVDSSFNIGSGAGDIVESVVLQPDGKILIGGYVGSVNGVPLRSIARLNQNGSLDSAFDAGFGFDQPV